MTSATLLSLLLLSESPTQLVAAANDGPIEGNAAPSHDRSLTRDRLARILHTAVDDESTFQHLQDDHEAIEDDNDRRHRGLGSHEVAFTQHDDAWDRMVQHGWDWSRRPHRQSQQRRNLRSGEDAGESAATHAPFVVCSETPGQSGYERRQAISQSSQVPMEHTQPIYNTDDESCFIVTSKAEAMDSYHSQLIQSDFDIDASNTAAGTDNVVFGPLMDVLKLPAGTATSILENDDWAPPRINSMADLASFSKRTYVNEFSYDNSTEEYEIDVRGWSRSIMVDLLPGTVSDGDGIASVAKEIVEYVKDMAQVPPESASNRLRGSNAESNDEIAIRFAAETSVSTRQAFSLTASSDDDLDENDVHKHTFHNRHNIWSHALKNGFEAPHGCQVLLDTLSIRARVGQDEINEDVESPLLAGFELILHPPSQFMKQAAVESSAWNKQCVLSLVMGLAVHPSVQTVEVGQSVELATLSMSMPTDAQPMARDGTVEPVPAPGLEQHSNSRQKRGITNPQWIVQSAKQNSRPFFDAGLDGSGQTVAVADGGLDRDNCYFRDASPSASIFGNNGWAMNQRKIVHYDDSFGDRTERSMGHGTYVSGILAGSRSADGRNADAGHADGTAPGADLAFFDMENGYFGISDPGVQRLLRSLYNPGGNKGARIINASWGRSYNGQYTSFCREYDAALRSKYPDMLFVVSAGNTGRAGAYSIQDPADCKSPMAVGSSLSDGNDIRDGELGIEYLADYSSRGPAKDGRMKPDIVAPGHFVLASRAVPGEKGECDGDRQPNVKTGVPGGTGAKYTTGTSMAAPALAGAAAIVRQYFEEGYCNSNGKCCGQRGCGSYMKPSGALLKAVLMNGAQPLKGGVQYVPAGKILKDQPLRAYDSNQGMGRVNLLNSVPLRGQNTMYMMVVNDKNLVNGRKDVYTVYADKSNGCNRPLSVTLAWYDSPGAIGCTQCVSNDIDVSVKTSTGTKYPNGRNSRDSKNTVERVRTTLKHGEEVRIVVEAKNFAQYSQKYSLAVTGCFKGNAQELQSKAAAVPPPTKNPTKRPTNQSGASSSSCPSNRLFQLTLNTANDAKQLSWNLIGSTSGGSPQTIMNGPKNSVYANNRQYMFSACLGANRRYRFQLRNKSGGSIQSSYKLTYGGRVKFNTQWGGGNLGKASTYRFKTLGNGQYEQLGSNAFATHVQFSDEAEISGDSGDVLGEPSPSHASRDVDESTMIKMMESSSVGSYSYQDSNDAPEYMLTFDEYESTERMLDDILPDDDDEGDELEQQEFELYNPSDGEYIDMGDYQGDRDDIDGFIESDEYDDEEGEEVLGEPLVHNTPLEDFEEDDGDAGDIIEQDFEDEDGEGEAIVNEDIIEFHSDGWDGGDSESV